MSIANSWAAVITNKHYADNIILSDFTIFCGLQPTRQQSEFAAKGQTSKYEQ
jgi:hypothetical protein